MTLNNFLMADTYLFDCLTCCNSDYLYVLNLLNLKSLFVRVNDKNYNFIVWFVTKKKHNATGNKISLGFTNKHTITPLVNDNSEVTIILHDDKMTVFEMEGDVYIKCSWTKFIVDTLNKNINIKITNSDEYDKLTFDFNGFEGSIEIFDAVALFNLSCKTLKSPRGLLDCVFINPIKIEKLIVRSFNDVNNFNVPIKKLSISHHNETFFDCQILEQIESLKINQQISKDIFIKINECAKEYNLSKLKLELYTIDETIFNIIINESKIKYCIKTTHMKEDYVLIFLKLNKENLKILINEIEFSTYQKCVQVYGYDKVNQIVHTNVHNKNYIKYKYSIPLVKRLYDFS